MGYSTDFIGSFTATPALNTEQIAFIKAFNETRRMQRDASIAETFDDPIRKAVNLPISEDGEYFVSGSGWYGQDNDASVLDYNEPPSTQPSLWCGWTINDDGSKIEWDGGEKFYNYIEWIKYIIDHFMKPWNISLDGQIEWQGKDSSDRGIITINDNNVQINGE